MTIFSAVLAQQLRREPGRPLITFYDHASGERTELSVTTYANWVAKTASLLDEVGLERGQRLRVDLPAHWLTPVVLGAAWTIGLEVDLGSAEEPDGVVCGPDGLATWGPWAAGGSARPVLASALLPLGVRFREPLPAGVLDLGVEVWGQPDAFTPYPPAEADDVALRLPGEPPALLSQAETWRTAAAGSLLADGGRLLSVASPASPPGFATFTEPLAKGGSLVLVAHPDADRLDSVMTEERCTHRHP